MWLVLWACGFRAPQPAEQWSETNMAERLRQAIRSWEGTPHRLGDNDRRGINCSGLVVRIYRDLFDCRTASAMSVFISNEGSSPTLPRVGVS